MRSAMSQWFLCSISDLLDNISGRTSTLCLIVSTSDICQMGRAHKSSRVDIEYLTPVYSLRLFLSPSITHQYANTHLIRRTKWLPWLNMYFLFLRPGPGSFERGVKTHAFPSVPSLRPELANGPSHRPIHQNLPADISLHPETQRRTIGVYRRTSPGVEALDSDDFRIGNFALGSWSRILKRKRTRASGFGSTRQVIDGVIVTCLSLISRPALGEHCMWTFHVQMISASGRFHDLSK